MPHDAPRRSPAVDRFVHEVRARLNGERAWRALRGSLLIGGACMLLVALLYVSQGHAVPAGWYPLVLGVTLAGAGAAWWWQRLSVAEAELFIDDHFDLHDSVCSLRGFERADRTGGFYALQAAQVEKAIAGLEAKQIPSRPRRVMNGAVVASIMLAVLLGFIPPGEAVRLQQLRAGQTHQQTAQINQTLDAYVQEMIETTDDEAAELIEPNKLRDWVSELKATEDLREAFRQYAAFDRDLTRMSAKLERQRDEALLTEAGQELARHRDTQELGQKLQRKQYREAADELAQMSPTDLQDLHAARERLDRFKTSAERMADASRRFQQNRARRGSQGSARAASAGQGRGQGGSGSSGSSGGGGQGGAAGGGAGGADEWSDGELAALLEQLAEDLEAYDAALGECEGGNGQPDGEKLRIAQQRGEQVGQRLARLRQRMNQMDTARRARQRLAGLCQTLGECQGTLAGQRLASTGGKQAGHGSAETFNNQQPTPADGELTRLQGSKGQGPSLSRVEDADSGTGVATRGQVADAFEFQRQVESFVQREDVPAPLRDGVKHYFENIHQGSAE